MYVRHIFQEAEKQDLYVQTYDSQSLICRRYTEETRLYCEASAIGWREDPDLLNHLREDPVKAVAIDYRNPERLCAFRSQLEPWAAGKVSMYFSSEFLLEFVSQGISKGARSGSSAAGWVSPRRRRWPRETRKMIFPCCRPLESAQRLPTRPRR